MNYFCCSRLFGNSDSDIGRIRLLDNEIQLEADKAG